MDASMAASDGIPLAKNPAGSKSETFRYGGGFRELQVLPNLSGSNANLNSHDAGYC